MQWNWQQPDWRNFRWDFRRLRKAEELFLLGSGLIAGTVAHLNDRDREQLTVEAIGAEALTTSEIEGEILDRASVQSSIRKQLGLATDRRRVKPAEQGIAELMVNLYRTYAEPLSDAVLFDWHRMVTNGRRDLRNLGAYRTDAEPIQVVSGSSYAPRVHFEAPPAERVPEEMARFVEWFQRTGPAGSDPLPALTRAGIAHIYFESIHPFEDGNGRIGRILIPLFLYQKRALSQPMFYLSEYPVRWYKSCRN